MRPSPPCAPPRSRTRKPARSTRTSACATKPGHMKSSCRERRWSAANGTTISPLSSASSARPANGPRPPACGRAPTRQPTTSATSFHRPRKPPAPSASTGESRTAPTTSATAASPRTHPASAKARASSPGCAPSLPTFCASITPKTLPTPAIASPSAASQPCVQ